MELYFVRHGQTDYNVHGKYYGWTDVPLNEMGKKQAKKLAKLSDSVSFDKIISSPLKRAYDTAYIIRGKKGTPIEREGLLCEQNFGIFEGKTYKEIQKEYPNELEAWNENFSDEVIPNGESFRQVRERIDIFVQKIKQEQKFEQKMRQQFETEGKQPHKRETKKILIVAHKGTLGHFFASMLCLPLDGYWNFVFEQGCYSHVSLEDGYAIIRTINERID